MGYSLIYIVLLSIQTVALVAAVFVARFAITHQRATAKKDKTIALLMKSLEDDFLKDGVKLLLEVHLDDHNDVAIYASKANSKKPESLLINNLLNYYENVAIGIKADIYDIEMIKKLQKTMIIRIYEQSKPYIHKVREVANNNNLYIEFKDFVEDLKSNAQPSFYNRCLKSITNR